MIDHRLPIGGEQRFWNLNGPLFIDVANGHADDLEANAEARGHECAIALDSLEDATANGAAANNAQFNLLHRKG